LVDVYPLWKIIVNHLMISDNYYNHDHTVEPVDRSVVGYVVSINLPACIMLTLRSTVLYIQLCRRLIARLTSDRQRIACQNQ
jgi:hypothetical protein